MQENEEFAGDLSCKKKRKRLTGEKSYKHYGINGNNRK